MAEKTKVVHMEHFDQNESNGNAATKYIVEFSGRVNCDWLWLVLEKALVLAQQDKRVYQGSERGMKMEIGQKVTYLSFGQVEHGVVKSLSDEEHVFVVYHCDGNWDRYSEYTAARTRICDLVPGWIVGEVTACPACRSPNIKCRGSIMNCETCGERWPTKFSPLAQAT